MRTCGLEILLKRKDLKHTQYITYPKKYFTKILEEQQNRKSPKLEYKVDLQGNLNMQLT